MKGPKDHPLGRFVPPMCIIGRTPQTEGELFECLNTASRGGLCHSHYQAAYRYVRNGKTTIDILKARGLYGTGGSPVGDCSFFDTGTANSLEEILDRDPLDVLGPRPDPAPSLEATRAADQWDRDLDAIPACDIEDVEHDPR